MATDQLLELLSEYTADYTRMAKDGAPHVEYYSCEQVLNLLQEELRFRKATLSTTEFNFESDASD
ncbi:MAG: hypothetical protein JO301_10985 [Chitinophagaceae bacterium]|nr:hypothetical protein [Chitinophagaceae bacterium]